MVMVNKCQLVKNDKTDIPVLYHGFIGLSTKFVEQSKTIFMLNIKQRL